MGDSDAIAVLVGQWVVKEILHGFFAWGYQIKGLRVQSCVVCISAVIYKDRSCQEMYVCNIDGV